MSDLCIEIRGQDASRCPSSKPLSGNLFRSSSVHSAGLKYNGCAKGRSRRVAVALHGTSKAREIVAAAAPDVPTVYFEPFMRSFILGLAAGAAFEAIHAAGKVASLVDERGWMDLIHALPNAWEKFAPEIVNGNIIGAATMMMLYVVEAVAVVKILDQHNQNPDEAAFALKTSTNLPKMMLPRLDIFQQLLTFSKVVKGISSTHGRPKRMTPTSLKASAVLERPSDLVMDPTSLPEAPKPVVEPKNVPHVLLPNPEPVTEPRDIPTIYTPRPMPPVSDPRQEPEGPGDPQDQEGSEQIKNDTTLQRKRKQAGLKPGQLEPDTAQVLSKMQELLERKMVMWNMWYAVGITEHVKDKPVAVEILGERLILIRDSDGGVRCHGAICPHRGAPLDKGWTETVDGQNCTVCPYHGWAFDMEGRLRAVPASESKENWPRRPLLETYHVEEKGGFVWLFHGPRQMPADERPPLPMVSQLEDPDWKAVYGEIEFDCNHWSVFENAIDMAHIHYLHSGSFGNRDKPQIKDISVKTEAFSVTGDFALHNKAANPLWQFAQVPEVRVHARAFLPSTSVIQFTLGFGLSFVTFVNTVPVSATRTVNRFALVRRLGYGPLSGHIFNMKIWDSFARDAMMRILGEDKVMVEKLEPDLIGCEISVKADLIQIAFRSLRRSFMKLGYGVDLSTKKAGTNKDM